MMGRQTDDQGHLFYDFRLDEAVPDDHPVRKIATVLDLSWVYGELAPYYPTLGRPSIDPVLMPADADHRLCFWPSLRSGCCGREVQVNFCLPLVLGNAWPEHKNPRSLGIFASAQRAVPGPAASSGGYSGACRGGLYRGRAGWRRRVCRGCESLIPRPTLTSIARFRAQNGKRPVIARTASRAMQ